MARKPKRLVLYSNFAFYKPIYQVFEKVCSDYQLEGHVIGQEHWSVPAVYEPNGVLRPETAGISSQEARVSLLAGSASMGQQEVQLKRLLRELRPDYLWVHEEPNKYLLNRVLEMLYFDRGTRIVVPVVENLWSRLQGRRDPISRLKRKVLWRRIDALLPTSSLALKNVRKFGMPCNIPAQVAWLPHLEPPPPGACREIPNLPVKKKGEIFVGFAGRITAAKGWRILFEAMKHLPENYSCVVAGSGDEEQLMQEACERPELKNRIHWLGLLEKESLWSFYRALDYFVLPSLTTSDWAEQFGAVLAEAMACGVPVIGSSSGSIPEVLDGCGMVFPEGDARALAKSILHLAENAEVRAELVRKAQERFYAEFSYRAYALKVAWALGLGR